MAKTTAGLNDLQHGYHYETVRPAIGLSYVRSHYKGRRYIQGYSRDYMKPGYESGTECRHHHKSVESASTCIHNRPPNHSGRGLLITQIKDRQLP